MKPSGIISFLRRRLSVEEAKPKAQLATGLLQRGQLDEALLICREELALSPQDYELICLIAEIAAKKGGAETAFEFFARAIHLRPNRPLAYYKRANLLRDCDRLEESLEDYAKAIALAPDFAHAFCNRGVVLQHLQRFQDALDSYGRAIELDPADAFALFNRAGLLRDLNRPGEALLSYQQAIEVKPDYAECFCNLGLLQASLGDCQAALTSYDQCIEIDATFFAAHFNRGVLLQTQERWQEAFESYSRVLELKPEHAEAFSNRGVVLVALGKFEAALMDFNRAIQLRPECAEAIFSRADVLFQAGQIAEAVDGYDAAFRVEPDRRYLRGMRLHAQMYLCDWRNVEAEREKVRETGGGDITTWPPFPLLTLVDVPELHRKCAQHWTERQASIPSQPAEFLKRAQGARIRIGYFSGDFRTHPVSTLMAGVIESHDRSKFEIFGFSYGPDVQDDMRRRMEKAFDRFLDVREIPDREIATMARNLELDVAVDLAGYTGNGRTKVFAWRAAPIQVSYLGYLGTMAAPFMDYLLADRTIIPVAEQQNYSEKIVYLPSYQANDSKRRISEVIPSREQLGLPKEGFVYACFNSNYKITPETFSVWMRILKRAQGSVLYLYAGNRLAEQNIRREAGKCDIDPQRVVFGERLPFEEYLARFSVMDLFLDTFPYNAGTTASDALWAGLPVLTCTGRAFAGRIAASLLAAINLPELITETAARYEDLAVKLATTPGMMSELRQKLVGNRVAAPLFNTAQFTRNLEVAYTRIVERQREGLPPDHVHVAGEPA